MAMWQLKEPTAQKVESEQGNSNWQITDSTRLQQDVLNKIDSSKWQMAFWVGKGME